MHERRDCWSSPSASRTGPRSTSKRWLRARNKAGGNRACIGSCDHARGCRHPRVAARFDRQCGVHLARAASHHGAHRSRMASHLRDRTKPRRRDRMRSRPGGVAALRCAVCKMGLGAARPAECCHRPPLAFRRPRGFDQQAPRRSIALGSTGHLGPGRAGRPSWGGRRQTALLALATLVGRRWRSRPAGDEQRAAAR